MMDATQVREAIERLGVDVGRAGHPAQLADMQRLHEALNDAKARAIDGLHGRGYSDTEIGAPLGITKQAVQKRRRAAR